MADPKLSDGSRHSQAAQSEQLPGYDASIDHTAPFSVQVVRHVSVSDAQYYCAEVGFRIDGRVFFVGPIGYGGDDRNEEIARAVVLQLDSWKDLLEACESVCEQLDMLPDDVFDTPLSEAHSMIIAAVRKATGRNPEVPS